MRGWNEGWVGGGGTGGYEEWDRWLQRKKGKWKSEGSCGVVKNEGVEGTTRGVGWGR